MNSLTVDRTEKTQIGAMAALVGVQITFGSLPVIAKVVLAVVPAVALVGFRVGVTAVILALVQVFRRRFWLRERSDYLRFAILSLFGVTFNQLLFIGGLSLTKASNTSLLAVTIPIFAIVLGGLTGIESFRRATIFGLVLAVVGVILIIDPRKASFSSETTIGDLLIILNSFCYGTYVATSKEAITRNGAFRSMMWVFLFASVICVPLGVWSISTTGTEVISGRIWLYMLHIAVVATAVPYLLNAWALARVPPSTVAVFIYLQPLIGFALAAIYLGESIDAAFIAAAVLIFAGLYFVTKRPVKRVNTGRMET
ncbi:MAG: DMT family transporter [Acidobacteria bacterium]|nr:DMT family transporter [Acidobacteriota bacterium]MCW5948797.1 DMT family transporter [Pyrinomonadaceae bacterium]